MAKREEELKESERKCRSLEIKLQKKGREEDIRGGPRNTGRPNTGSGQHKQEAAPHLGNLR